MKMTQILNTASVLPIKPCILINVPMGNLKVGTGRLYFKNITDGVEPNIMLLITLVIYLMVFFAAEI